jgi:hypothetical protein
MTSELDKINKPVDFHRFEQAMKRIEKMSKKEVDEKIKTIRAERATSIINRQSQD